MVTNISIDRSAFKFSIKQRKTLTYLTMKMKAPWCFEMSVNTYQSTRLNIPPLCEAQEVAQTPSRCDYFSDTKEWQDSISSTLRRRGEGHCFPLYLPLSELPRNCIHSNSFEQIFCGIHKWAGFTAVETLKRYFQSLIYHICLVRNSA
jgi:hypothetical protein